MIMWDIETLQIMGVHLRKQPLLLVYTVKRNESANLHDSRARRPALQYKCTSLN